MSNCHTLFPSPLPRERSLCSPPIMFCEPCRAFWPYYLCACHSAFMWSSGRKKFIVLAAAAKAVQGGCSCHLEQAVPLANTLSPESFSPGFSTGFCVLLPTNRSSRKLCSEFKLQTPFASPGEGQQLRAPFARSLLGHHHWPARRPIWCSAPFGRQHLQNMFNNLQPRRQFSS